MYVEVMEVNRGSAGEMGSDPTRYPHQFMHRQHIVTFGVGLHGRLV